MLGVAAALKNFEQLRSGSKPTALRALESLHAAVHDKTLHAEDTWSEVTQQLLVQQPLPPILVPDKHDSRVLASTLQCLGELLHAIPPAARDYARSNFALSGAWDNLLDALLKDGRRVMVVRSPGDGAAWSLLTKLAPTKEILGAVKTIARRTRRGEQHHAVSQFRRVDSAAVAADAVPGGALLRPLAIPRLTPQLKSVLDEHGTVENQPDRPQTGTRRPSVVSKLDPATRAHHERTHPSMPIMSDALAEFYYLLQAEMHASTAALAQANARQAKLASAPVPVNIPAAHDLTPEEPLPAEELVRHIEGVAAEKVRAERLYKSAPEWSALPSLSIIGASAQAARFEQDHARIARQSAAKAARAVRRARAEAEAHLQSAERQRLATERERRVARALAPKHYGPQNWAGVAANAKLKRDKHGLGYVELVNQRSKLPELIGPQAVTSVASFLGDADFLSKPDGEVRAEFLRCMEAKCAEAIGAAGLNVQLASPAKRIAAHVSLGRLPRKAASASASRQLRQEYEDVLQFAGDLATDMPPAELRAVLQAAVRGELRDRVQEPESAEMLAIQRASERLNKFIAKYVQLPDTPKRPRSLEHSALVASMSTTQSLPQAPRKYNDQMPAEARPGWQLRAVAQRRAQAELGNTEPIIQLDGTVQPNPRVQADIDKYMRRYYSASSDYTANLPNWIARGMGLVDPELGGKPAVRRNLAALSARADAILQSPPSRAASASPAAAAVAAVLKHVVADAAEQVAACLPATAQHASAESADTR